ncbi:MAG: hypothetical protein K0R54_311 [Clostridiaceae bacterium]|jgi:hypothetical protein|nr:hypothetical protein [Clostridiaceae bacterium]
MDSYNIFARLNYKNSNIISNNNYETVKIHIDNKLDEVSSKYWICGGIYNKYGRTMIFKAKNINEINEFTKNIKQLKNTKINYDVFMLPKSIV